LPRPARGYAIAHDLRAIDRFIGALLKDHGCEFRGQARRHLDRLRDAAQYMARLIDGLLALGAGRFEADLGPPASF
jgi:hypothetical protein